MSDPVSSPLTDAEIAELRRFWAPAVAADSETAKEVMRVLDELERLRGIVGATEWVAEESGPKDSYVWVRQRRPR